MESLPSLTDLIQLVEKTTPDSDSLQQLTDSVVLSGRVADLGDELVGHFVTQARSAGATWAEIGECMGVSKQAAQKRFTGRGPRRGGGLGSFFTRFADEARQVVRRASTHARETGSSHVGTEHLVVGMTDDPESLAFHALAGLGSIEEIRSAAQSVVEPKGGSRGGGHIPFSSDAKKVLELALRETIRSGDRRIGTQHILLGILRDKRSAGALLLIERGITHQAVDAWIEEG